MCTWKGEKALKTNKWLPVNTNRLLYSYTKCRFICKEAELLHHQITTVGWPWNQGCVRKTEMHCLQYAVSPLDATKSHTMGLEKQSLANQEILITCYRPLYWTDSTSALDWLPLKCHWGRSSRLWMNKWKGCYNLFEWQTSVPLSGIQSSTVTTQ